MTDLNNYLLGTIGVDDRGADFHPEYWESEIKKITARIGPMTALMDSMGKEKTTSRAFHWSEQNQYEGMGDVTDVYTEPTLTTAYTTGGVEGAALYFKVDPALAKQIVTNNQFTVFNSETGQYIPFLCTNTEIISESVASIAGILLDDDGDDMLAESTLELLVSSTAMEEGSSLPDPISFEPTWHYNLVQKHAASWSATEEELIELERVNPNFAERQRTMCLERFMANKERAFLLGKAKRGTGVGGKGQYMTDGLITVINREAPDNVFDFVTDDDPAVVGETFLNAWLPWFQERYELLCRNGEADEKIAFVSGWGVVKLNQLFQSQINYNVSSPATVYGIRVYRVITPHQPLLLVEHPLFTRFTPLHSAMLIYERHLVNEREMVPFRFIPDMAIENPRSGWEHRAAVFEGYEQTSGLKWNNASAMGLFYGIGKDNTVQA